MRTTDISAHTELVLHIMLMETRKFRYEDELKSSLKEFVDTLNPISMLKGSGNKRMKNNIVQYVPVNSSSNKNI
jgi:hypothetical protein